MRHNKVLFFHWNLNERRGDPGVARTFSMTKKDFACSWGNRRLSSYEFATRPKKYGFIYYMESGNFAKPQGDDALYGNILTPAKLSRKGGPLYTSVFLEEKGHSRRRRRVVMRNVQGLS